MNIKDEIEKLEELANELRDVDPTYENYIFLAGKISGERNTARNALKIINKLMEVVETQQRMINRAEKRIEREMEGTTNPQQEDMLKRVRFILDSNWAKQLLGEESNG